MSNLIPKRLTGWLILLIILIGTLQFGGASQSLTTVPESFRPHLSEYPSLSAALIVFRYPNRVEVLADNSFRRRTVLDLGNNIDARSP